LTTRTLKLQMNSPCKRRDSRRSPCR
jgi:hypothetical protein